VQGIALDDNEFTALPDVSAFPRLVWAISIKRNNITTLIVNDGLTTTNFKNFALDMSENRISSLSSGFFNTNINYSL
jgi:hypothetical protein